LDRIPILQGLARDLWWVADESGRFRAKDYFDEELSDVERRRFRVAFEQMAEAGAIVNEERYRKEGPNLASFKAGKHRLLCFRDGRDVMLVAAFRKKSDKDKRLARVIKTAERIRDAYLDQQTGN
jgi:hypothetical protein